MSDLAGGRYPDSEEEWLLDGQPSPPFRRSISRRDITVSTVTLTQANILCVAVPVQAGDIFSVVSLAVKTATATPTHSWVAVYNGVKTGAQLLAQSADVTTGFPASTTAGLSLTLASVVSNLGSLGTSQGPSTGAIVAQGPAIWGVAIYNSGATSAVFDGMAGGVVTGGLVHAGQVPLITTGALAATATAPAVLPTMANGASGIGIPYVLLSRS